MEGKEEEEEEEEEEGGDGYYSLPEEGDDEGDFYSSSSPSLSLASAHDSSIRSSVASSSFCSEAEPYYDIRDRAHQSEYEEIPSLRWLPRSFRWTSSSRSRRHGTTRSSPSESGADDWEERLPSDYKEILARAVVPVKFSSYEDLYVRLCSSILIDEGKKCFSLDKSTGMKRYVLSARELEITWGREGSFCHWTAVPQSRFSEVAELMTVWWSGIRGKIDARALSPGTTYIACLMFGYSGRSFGHGLIGQQQETSITVDGRQVSGHAVCLQSNGERRSAGTPRQRTDGWTEILIGEFYVLKEWNGDGEVVVDLSLNQVEILYENESILGLVVEGIEVRPKDQLRRKKGFLNRLFS